MNELEIINNQLSMLKQEYARLEEQGKLTREYDNNYCILVQELCVQRTLIYWRQMQEKFNGR